MVILKNSTKNRMDYKMAEDNKKSTSKTITETNRKITLDESISRTRTKETVVSKVNVTNTHNPPDNPSNNKKNDKGNS